MLPFDEPLSNLDARLRRTMREEIRALQQRLGLTVAYVTHDQGDALAVSDRIIVINRGVIAQEGTPQDLYERPASEFVAGFMGEAMLLHATWGEAGQVLLGGHPVHARGSGSAGSPGDAVALAVRPEAWRIGRPGQGEIDGTVAKAAHLGSTREYSFATVLVVTFVVTHDTALALRTGERVSLRIAGTCAVVDPDPGT